MILGGSYLLDNGHDPLNRGRMLWKWMTWLCMEYGILDFLSHSFFPLMFSSCVAQPSDPVLIESGRTLCFQTFLRMGNSISKKSLVLFIKKNQLPNSSPLNWIWEIDTIPKIRFFLWLTFHDRLLTRTLRVRHMIDSNICGCCQSGIENSIHILRDCPKAKKVWEHFRVSTPFFPTDNSTPLYRSVA